MMCCLTPGPKKPWTEAFKTQIQSKSFILQASDIWLQPGKLAFALHSSLLCPELLSQPHSQEEGKDLGDS